MDAYSVPMFANAEPTPAASVRLVPIVRVRLLRETEARAPEQMTCPAAAASFACDRIGASDREETLVIMLDAKHRAIAAQHVAVGGLSECNVYMGGLFRAAILANASSIIVAHNHPSGDVTPSPEDGDLTREVVAAGKLLGIEVLDHVIVNDRGDFRSLKALGMGFG